MVVIQLVLMAKCQFVEWIHMPEESDWHLNIKCSHCNQQFPNEVTFSLHDDVEMNKQHGKSNFSAKCKNCQRKGFICIDLKSSYKASPDQNGNIKSTIALMECRGLEITKVNIGNSMTIKVINSPTEYTNADLTDLWCQYDENIEKVAQVSNAIIAIK